MPKSAEAARATYKPPTDEFASLLLLAVAANILIPFSACSYLGGLPLYVVIVGVRYSKSAAVYIN